MIAELLELNRQTGELLGAMGPSSGQRHYLEYRAQIGRLQAKFDELNNELSSMLGLTSAKARMLAYLELHALVSRAAKDVCSGDGLGVGRSWSACAMKSFQYKGFKG